MVQLLGLPPAHYMVARMGNVSSDPAYGWLDAQPLATEDPWGRDPAFMGYVHLIHGVCAPDS